MWLTLFDPRDGKTSNVAVHHEDTDQPSHQHSLIRVCTVLGPEHTAILRLDWADAKADLSLCLGQIKKIPAFRETHPYLNLMTNPRIFFRFSGKNTILNA